MESMLIVKLALKHARAIAIVCQIKLIMFYAYVC